MSLTNNHFTIILGIDIHFTMLPPFNPLHPFIGLVMDPMDYIPFIGATVQVNGRKRGVSDTSGMLVFLRHFPLFNGPFVETPFIAHQSVNFFGSVNTYAQGRRLSPTTYMKMTCNDIGIPLSMHPGTNWKPMPSLFAPTSFSIPVPSGPPVNLGGPYVPDLAGMIINLLASYGFGALMKGAGKLLSRYGKNIASKASEAVRSTVGKIKTKLKCKWDPVDMVTGRVIYEGCDFELPGMLPLKWERYWYSDSRVNGLLGYGTTCIFDTKLLVIPEEDYIAVLLPDGRAAGFDHILPGQESYNRSERLTLRNEGEYYTLFNSATRLIYVYERNPYAPNAYRIASIRNEQDFEISLAYNNGHLERIVDSAARRLEVTTDEQRRITSITLEEHNGKSHVLVNYAYNEAGDLHQISDALHQSVQIEYQHHLMVKKTDRNGQSFYWEYDARTTGARCVHTWGDGGLQEGFVTYHKGYNVATDNLGRTTTYYYDENDLVTQITDAEGFHQFTDYTDFEEVYRQVDEEGNVTGYRYDERGNQVAVIAADGSETQLHYEAHDLVTMVIDAEGNSTIRVYNDDLQLESVIHADNGIQSYEYDARKRMSTARDNDNKATRLAYDTDDNLTDLQLPDGSKTHWDYDGLGRCIRRVNARGGVQSFIYDPLGRATRIQQPDGNVIWLEYDAYEDVIKARDSQHEVKLAYTPLGSIIRREEKNRVLRYGYNAQEELVSVMNEHRESWYFERNKKGEIVSEKAFDGMVRYFRRQGNGLVQKIERAEGRHTLYEYDQVGRMVRAEYSDGTWEIYNYDKNGWLTEATNEQTSLYFTRDALGRVASERVVANGQQYETHTKHNRVGKRVSLTSSLGAQMQMEYTDVGQVAQLSAKHQDAEQWSVKMQYNELGLETDRWLPGGIISHFEYDSAGHPYRQTVRSGQRETRKRLYTWNANDRLISMLNEQTNGIVNYGHDDFNNLAWAEFEDGEKQTKAHDAAGNVYRSATLNDRRYDEGGQLSDTGEGWHYRYDAEGNLTEKSNGAGTKWSYEWYGNGMLKNVQRPDGQNVSFEYDALSRRTAKIAGGKITRWIWNGNVPLHEWSYPVKDRPVSQINAIGEMEVSHTETTEGLITWVFNEGRFAPAAKLTADAQYSIITDYLGTPVEMYDELGQKTWAAELDIYGKVRKMTQGNVDDCPFRYQGQYEDVETGLYYNRFRYYAPEEGIYISQDPIGLQGGMQLYGYVRDVNWLVDIAGLSDSSILAKALEDAGEFKPGDDYDAHHMIMANSKDPRMDALRKQMGKFDPPIGKNEAENGVWLPRNEAAREAGDIATAHKGQGVHSDAYKQHVYDRLNGKPREDFVAEMGALKRDLLNGKTFKCK